MTKEQFNIIQEMEKSKFSLEIYDKEALFDTNLKKCPKTWENI